MAVEDIDETELEIEEEIVPVVEDIEEVRNPQYEEDQRKNKEYVPEDFDGSVAYDVSQIEKR